MQIADFGVTVSLADGMANGLLHVSQISELYVRNISAIFAVGQPILCVVLKVDASVCCGEHLALNLPCDDVPCDDVPCYRFWHIRLADSPINLHLAAFAPFAPLSPEWWAFAGCNLCIRAERFRVRLTVACQDGSISLSTKRLESTPGEMVRDSDTVYQRVRETGRNTVSASTEAAGLRSETSDGSAVDEIAQ